MKKTFLLGLLVVLFILGGCGTSTNKEEESKDTILICSKSTKNTIDFITEMTFYYEKDKTKEIKVKYTYDLSSYTEEQRTTFAASNICESDSFKNSLGIRDCKEELSGSDYIVTGYADKLVSQAVGTLKLSKESYEKEGWTCTSR